MIVMAVLLLRGTGIICGRIAGSFFGLHDTRLVSEASWVGIPEGGYEGINLNFSTDFQVLLPVFVLVMVVSSIKTVGRSLPFSVCHGATHVPQISESPRLRWCKQGREHPVGSHMYCAEYALVHLNGSDPNHRSCIAQCRQMHRDSVHDTGIHSQDNGCCAGNP